MDWPLAIERNRKALQLIIAALFALSGGTPNTVVTTLPRHLYRSILQVLRPAESALRRLIIIIAYGLKVNPPLSKPFSARIAPSSNPNRLPAFCLVDPLKRFSTQYVSVEDPWNAQLGQGYEAKSEGHNVTGKITALPRISVPGFYDPAIPTSIIPSLNDTIDAKYIMRRLLALSRALENLPREARRLARWQARRPLVLSQNKPARVSPFRPGRPPGFRLRTRHEVHGVLRECHMLALDRLDTPNSTRTRAQLLTSPQNPARYSLSGTFVLLLLPYTT